MRTKHPECIKPQFGNIDQILLVRKYDRIMKAELPVIKLTDWETDEDFEVVCSTIECPNCFNRHYVRTDNNTGEFLMDSNHCNFCEQEFCFHEESEFDLYVKPDEHEEH